MSKCRHNLLQYPNSIKSSARKGTILCVLAHLQHVVHHLAVGSVHIPHVEVYVDARHRITDALQTAIQSLGVVPKIGIPVHHVKQPTLPLFFMKPKYLRSRSSTSRPNSWRSCSTGYDRLAVLTGCILNLRNG